MRNVICSVFIILSFGLSAQQSDAVPAAVEKTNSVDEIQTESIEELKISSRKASVNKKNQRDQKLVLQSVESSQNSSVFKAKKHSSSNQKMQRSPNQSQQLEMDKVVQYFDSIAPNSFEYNYYKYVSSNYDVGQVSNLVKAESIRPGNIDVESEMAGYYIIKNDHLNGLFSIDKVVNSGKLSKEVLLYSEDILLSAPKNSTLITHGFDDTYSTWYTQNKKKLRKDVRIISLDFLQSTYYRNQLISEGYVMPKSNIIDVVFFTEFCRVNAAKNIVVSLTTPREYFKPNANKFFITGIVMSYSSVGSFNFQENEKLWNYTLKKHLVSGASNEKGKQLSSNYLPMLLQMRKVYNSLGSTKKVSELDISIDKVSVQSKNYDKVEKLKGRY